LKIVSERIKAIITYILTMEPESFQEMLDLRPKLKEMGYTSYEIKQALKLLEPEWLEPLKGSVTRFLSPEWKASNRVFSDEEKITLSVAAQGYLLSLVQMGMIGELEMHLIIEKAAYDYSPPVSLEEIKEILLQFHDTLPDNAKDSENRDHMIN